MTPAIAFGQGWAVKGADKLLMKSVADTRRGAIVAFLFHYDKRDTAQLSDRELERLWLDAQSRLVVTVCQIEAREKL